MRLAITAAVAIALAAPAAAQRDTADDRRWFAALRAHGAGCEDPLLDLPNPHVINYREHGALLASRMLRVDPASCPGVRDAALGELRTRIGDPERADVPVPLMRMLFRETGEARLGRMLWLFDERTPAPPGWSEAQREAWLARPETLALLEARNADDGLRTRRSVELHADLLLRRGSAAYAPAEAVKLLETWQANGIPGNRERLVALLLDGEHMPPDYGRAARQYLSLAAAPLDYAAEPQRELLRIGRLAAAAARTPAEQGAAFRILSAAALDGRFGSGEAEAAMLDRIGAVPEGALAPGDAERIGRALDFQFAFDLPDRQESDPPELRPILLRGLVGPDGRLVMTQVVQSSGAASRDRIVRGIWASDGHRVDLSATARGRFVWVDLPAVDPLLTTMEASQRWPR
ncbi:MAG TPA: hypothetical protein VGB08_05315 [Allosphingosinicella sp.]|jgi:hypothetical protein